MTTPEYHIELVKNTKNKETLEKFLTEEKTSNKSQHTLVSKFRFLRDLANEYSNKSYKQINRNDIAKFIAKMSETLKPSSIGLMKAHIKHFYKWLEGDGETSPDKVKWLEIKTTSSELTYEDMVTEEEIISMAKVSTPRDACVIVTLFDSGMRAGEFLGLRLKDIHFNKDTATLNIPANVSKTYARPVYVVRAVPYLKAYLETHQDKNNPDASLWLKVDGTPMDNNTIINILRLAKDRIKSTKNIHPHLLRHSRATEVMVRKSMTEMEMRMFFGWAKNSNMPSFYAHLASQHVENAVRIEAGLSEAERPKSNMKPLVCPKCGALNPPTYMFCYKCATPLTDTFNKSMQDILFKRIIGVYEHLDNDKKMKVLIGMLTSIETVTMNEEEIKAHYNEIYGKVKENQ